MSGRRGPHRPAARPPPPLTGRRRPRISSGPGLAPGPARIPGDPWAPTGRRQADMAGTARTRLTSHDPPSPGSAPRRAGPFFCGRPHARVGSGPGLAANRTPGRLPGRLIRVERRITYSVHVDRRRTSRAEGVAAALSMPIRAAGTRTGRDGGAPHRRGAGACRRLAICARLPPGAPGCLFVQLPFRRRSVLFQNRAASWRQAERRRQSAVPTLSFSRDRRLPPPPAPMRPSSQLWDVTPAWFPSSCVVA